MRGESRPTSSFVFPRLTNKAMLLNWQMKDSRRAQAGSPLADSVRKASRSLPVIQKPICTSTTSAQLASVVGSHLDNDFPSGLKPGFLRDARARNPRLRYLLS
jgi:hypothetical protein